MARKPGESSSEGERRECLQPRRARPIHGESLRADATRGQPVRLQESNPVDVAVPYAGKADEFGTAKDPMTGKRIGGVNVFGGGLALYADRKLGALGVSGDSSCADHNIAWRVRKALGLDHVPAGVSPNKDDEVVYDIANGKSKGGFGHPICGGKEAEVAVQVGAGAVVQ